jgi:hypothetical protein
MALRFLRRVTFLFGLDALRGCVAFDRFATR